MLQGRRRHSLDHGQQLDPPISECCARLSSKKTCSRRRGMDDLVTRIGSRKVVVGIVGLGYVGLPMSMLTANKYKVVGYDIDADLVQELQRGLSRVEDVPQSTLTAHLGRSFFPTSREGDLDACDIFV